MTISHFRFILFNLKVFGEIVTTLNEYRQSILCLSVFCDLVLYYCEK